MKKFVLLLIGVLMVSCQKKSEVGSEMDAPCTCAPIIVLQPCNSFTETEAQRMVPQVQEFINKYPWMEFEIDVMPPIKLADSLRNDARTRYRADKVIKAMAKEGSKHNVVILLTHDDISLPYKGHADWGVLGLSVRHHYVCMASDYRLRNKRRDLWKVAMHEFIHTYYHRSHCPNDDVNCIMKDAKGKADFGNKNGLCERCREEASPPTPLQRARGVGTSKKSNPMREEDGRVGS